MKQTPPILTAISGNYPHTTLQASGRAVGLPDGQMGNSEVGHMTIGCGSILRQDLVRIEDAIEDGSFYKNHSLLNALGSAKADKRPLHLLGLVSDGGVHSHMTHIIALLKACMEHNVKPVLHVITDGRDTAPKIAKQFIQQLQNVMDNEPAVKLPPSPGVSTRWIVITAGNAPNWPGMRWYAVSAPRQRCLASSRRCLRRRGNG